MPSLPSKYYKGLVPVLCSCSGTSTAAASDNSAAASCSSPACRPRTRVLLVLGSWVGARRPFHLSLLLTVSRMVLPQDPSTTVCARGRGFEQAAPRTRGFSEAFQATRAAEQGSRARQRAACATAGAPRQQQARACMHSTERATSAALAPALFQPHGKVRARPGPSGEALCMGAPCKRHVVNDATRSLRV